jgi:GT2 family glycosyltransferase
LLFTHLDTMSLLSVCIVNWNTREHLRATLSSLETHPATIAQEVIVVDNASTDGSADMVSAEFPAVKLVVNTTNVGYAEGNNIALSAASGDWLLLLNPDVKVLPSTLDNAIETAKEMRDLGALGIKQIGLDGTIQRSVRSFPEPLGVLWELIGLSKLFSHSRFFSSYRMNWFDYRGTIEVDQPMATFLLTTRPVFEAVGLMDKNFPIFFNDVDWCYRIKCLGKKIYYTDRAEIIHYGGAGTSRANRSKMAAESKKSFLAFYAKYYKNTLPGPVYHLICSAVKLSLALQRLRANI